MADVNIDKTALSAAVAIGQKIGQPVTTEPIHFAIVPNDSRVESLAALQYPHGIRPDRRKANVKLQDAGSFIGYVQLYADDRTRVFADATKFNFLSILDYHGTGERQPEFLDHRASFQMALSDQWKTWFGKNDTAFSQSDFADFLEDNAADIRNPEAATMLEVASDLRAKIDVNFESKTVRKNGQNQLTYNETINASIGKGNLEVPERFTIGIPVFYGEDPISVQCRLRFRIAGGKLSFHYKMDRASEVQNEAFDKAVASIGHSLGISVLIGTI